MPDEAYLNQLVAQATDPIAKRLIEEFSKIVRDPSISASEYPVRLRKVMDLAFKSLIDAPA